MRTLEEIVELYKERKRDSSPQLAKMREIRDAYNGDIVLPVPELNQNERSTVANLLALGIDQNARRIASTLPNIDFAVDKPGIKKSENAAESRRKAMFGMWDDNKMHMKLYRRARWFVAYTTAPVLVRPDPGERRTPLWQLRDPLTAFPAPSGDIDEIHPADCIFVYQRSASWMRRNYPAALRALNTKSDDASMFEILEYADDEQLALAVISTRKNLDPWQSDPNPGLTKAVMLEGPIVNRAGIPLAVTPGRITLDRPQGQFDGIVGIYQAQAQLNALELIGIKRGVFKEQWFVHHPQEMNAEILVQADGMKGTIGELKGGQLVEFGTDPSILGTQAVDRMERAQRVSAGIPAEYGGESTTNVRTGRRGDAILSATIDFPVQEAQLILEASLECENKIAIAVDKAYYGNDPKSFYVNWKGATGRLDYRPVELWTTDEHSVNYSHAGADVNGLVVAGGERVGMGTMSKHSFMMIDPLVDDPETEHARVISEGIEQALMQSVQQQASTGAIPPHFIARIMQLIVAEHVDLADAVDRVHKEAQAAQAQQVQPGAPAAQAGLAQPGAGAEASIAGPTAGQANLSDLLNSLRRPMRAGPSEQGAAVVPNSPELAGALPTGQ